MTGKQKGNLEIKNLNEILSKNSAVLLKDSVDYLKSKENLKKLGEGACFIATLCIFIFIHVCWLKNSSNWGSSVMVGILQIIALVAIFPMVRTHVFKEITIMFRGQVGSKSKHLSNDERKTR